MTLAIRLFRPFTVAALTLATLCMPAWAQESVQLQMY